MVGIKFEPGFEVLDRNALFLTERSLVLPQGDGKKATFVY